MRAELDAIANSERWTTRMQETSVGAYSEI